MDGHLLLVEQRLQLGDGVLEIAVTARIRTELALHHEEHAGLAVDAGGGNRRFAPSVTVATSRRRSTCPSFSLSSTLPRSCTLPGWPWALTMMC